MNRMPLAAVCVAVAAVLAACASLPPADAPTTRVSPDYVAAGDASGVRAFVYGKRTVLELPSGPTWLSVRDENGVAVEYEKEGRYYRLARRLDKFSVWLNTRALVFTAVPPAKPAPAAAPASAPASEAAVATANAEPVKLQAAPAVASPADDEAKALLQLSAQQLDELRQAVGAATPAEAKLLNARLDRIEGQLVRAATAIVRVQFETAQTEFEPSERVARVLVPAAKAAERVNVRGRTDSRVPGADDPRIALARALAARQFLVDRGVDGSKIKVFSLPAGDFAAPAGTEEGRALNRRVEIELVNRRYAALSERAASLARAGQ